MSKIYFRFAFSFHGASVQIDCTTEEADTHVVEGSCLTRLT